MSRNRSLRASDADRERVVQRLHTAATEGRLSSDELDDRVHRALTALTYGELDAVLADLPRPADAGHRAPHGDGTLSRRRAPAPARRTVGGWALTAVRANPLLLIFMIPIVATTGAMLLAAAVTWMTLCAVVTLLGGRHGRSLGHRRGPWTLMWSAEDRF